MIAIPEWRRRLEDRPPLAEWWRRRHHCSPVKLGQLRDVDKPCYDGSHQSHSLPKGDAQ